jgi:hypothetical protein
VTHQDHQDEQLLSDVGAAIAAADAVPAAVLDAAKASFTWRTVDAELAELVFDSATEELVGVRSASETTRQMTFRAPGVEIEVSLLSEGTRRIIGQLVPPQHAEIELRYGTESRRVTTDHLGRFTLHDVPVGPVSLRCIYGDDAAVVQTDWMLL